MRCFKCEKTSQCVTDCKIVGLIEQGHINTNCQMPKKVQSGGKVFALSRSYRICFINSIPLIAIIDMGPTNSFVLLDYSERLGFKLSSMVGSMIVDTPTLSSVTTSWVSLNCLLIIYGKSFEMDLVCLPLRNLDVILGMN